MFHFFEHRIGLLIAMDLLAQRNNPKRMSLPQRHFRRDNIRIVFQGAQVRLELDQSPGILFEFVEERGTSLAEEFSPFSDSQSPFQKFSNFRKRKPHFLEFLDPVKLRQLPGVVEPIAVDGIDMRGDKQADLTIEAQGSRGNISQSREISNPHREYPRFLTLMQGTG